MPCGLLIADSGPLIALTRLELLPQLCSRFDEVWLPGKVLDEVTRDMRREDAGVIASAVAQGLLKRVEVTAEETSAVLRFGLDPGESEAIALACRQPALLLIDERKGRLAAKSLGLAIIGVVGVLITLRAERVIPAAKPYFDRLAGFGYFLSDELVRQALRQIGEG